MKTVLTGLAVAVLAVLGYTCAVSGASEVNKTPETPDKEVTEESLDIIAQTIDSCTVADGVILDEGMPSEDDSIRYSKLSDEDFAIVAKELGVEMAAIKAVVLIEAGQKMQGFWAPGVPVVNFDRSMYNRYARSAPNRAGATGEKVPAGLKGHALQEWTQLINARKTNAQGANMGTFWGMFQIGGFHYKKLGYASVDDFVRQMSMSEFDQLQIFAKFITVTGMVDDLRSKNWTKFARKYNGSSYARRGYHTKMANAYAKFKKQEK